MSVEDRLAILELIAHYAYTWDSRDAAGWAALFLEDAIWESYRGGATPAVTLRSHAARREFSQASFDGALVGVRTRHYQTGTVFDTLTADTARTRTMILATRWPAGEDAPSPSLSGVYEDELRKTAAGWRFARRTLRRDQAPRS